MQWPAPTKCEKLHTDVTVSEVSEGVFTVQCSLCNNTAVWHYDLTSRIESPMGWWDSRIYT